MAPRRAGTLRSPSGKKHTVFGTEWMCIGRLITVISASTSVIWTGSSVIGLVACPTCAVSALRAAHCSAYSTLQHAAGRRTIIQTDGDNHPQLSQSISSSAISSCRQRPRYFLLVKPLTLTFTHGMLTAHRTSLIARHSFLFWTNDCHFLKYSLISPNIFWPHNLEKDYRVLFETYTVCFFPNTFGSQAEDYGIH